MRVRLNKINKINNMDINNKLVLRVLNSPWANDIKTPVDLSKTDKFYPIYQSFDNNFIYLKGEAIHTATTKDSKLVINKTNGEDIEVDLSSVNTLQNVLDNGSVAVLTTPSFLITDTNALNAVKVDAAKAKLQYISGASYAYFEANTSEEAIMASSDGVSSGSSLKLTNRTLTYTSVDGTNGFDLLVRPDVGMLITNTIAAKGMAYHSDYFTNGYGTYGDRWIPDYGAVQSAITNSISGFVETSLFNTYTGDTETTLNSKLNISDFNTYSGNVQTQISGKLNTSDFDIYSGNVQTQISGKLDTTTFVSYTGSVKDVHVTSGTVNAQNQSITFTNTSGGTFNLSNAKALFTTDSYVTGGTYNPNTGVVTYKTSTGFTFGVSGFTTGMTDTYVTNGKLEGTKLKLTKSDGGAVSDIELSGLQIWDKNNTSAYYNTGNVGIGTDSPDGPLHVETPTGTATIRVKSSGNTSSAFHAINKDGNAITLGINGSNLKLNSSGSLTNNHLVINSSGNVGINTGSPSQKLEVNGVTKSDVFAVRNDVNTRIISPQGAEYENDKANQPGRIKITAPADISSSSQATQFKSTIKVFYTEGEFDLHVSCYIQNNGSSTKPMVWQYAWIDSPPDGNNKYNFKVRLYFDEDNKFAIAIGDENSRWGRLKVVVTDVILAWNNDSIDEWSTGWSIKLDNYLDEEGLPKAVLDDDISTNNVTPITTISATQANNWGKAGNSLKYDGGDVNISSGSLIINDYILPSSKGTNGQLLKLKDDNGNLEWVDASSLQTQSIWTETVDTATYDGNIVANSLSSQSSNTCRVINPEGATYFKSETSNGSIIIRLPQGWTNSHINMKVKIYEYSSDEDITLNISGYNYKNDGHTNGGYWAKTTAWIEGSPEDVDNHNIPVHFGYDKELEKCIIFLGGEDFSWGTFLSVYVTDVQVSGNYTTDGVKASDVSRWNSAWYIFRSDNWSTTKIGDTETNRFITNANTTVENTQTNNWIRNTDDSIIYNKGTVNIGVRPISEDNLKLFATSDSSNEDKNIIPEIGISGSTHTALGYGSSTTNSYGIAMGTLQASGRSWIQSKRFRGADGHPDDLYDLLLNPLGGDVGIGTETPTEKLEVAGGIKVSDTSSSLTINNYTLPATDGSVNQVLKTDGDGVVTWQDDIDTDTSIWSVNAGTATYGGNIIADSISSVASDNVRILNPAGGEYSSGTKKGYIVITLPQGWTNTMISMTVKIFDYTQHEHATLNLAGYTYAGSFTSTNTAIAQWTATSAWVEGNPIDEHNFKVRFGYDNAKDKCVIVIGNVDTTWSIPKVYITDLQVAANNYQSSKWNDGWDIIISDTVDISAGRTSDTGIWIDDTHHSTQAHNWVRNTDNSIKYQSGNVKILGGNSLTINDYTFPATKGGAGQVLKTDANGNVTWQNDIDTDTNTSIWSENTSYTRNSDNSNISGAYYNTGNVGIGTDKPQSKLHLEGSNFDNSGIRFLNNANNNQAYWTIGSRAFSSGADGFEIGRNFGVTGGDTTGGKLYITNDGDVSIGNGYEPTNKLEVAGSALISKPNSASNILSVGSIYGNLTYGGASGVGDSTNNLILKHKNSGGAGTTSSTIGLKSANDESSISLTSYYTTNGTTIDYNAIVMNAGDSQVNIIAADNNSENSILSIQADESISFQSSINNAGSWPEDSKKTMTIDLTNDKVVIDGGFTLNNGTQGVGKVLTSDANGTGVWGNYGLTPIYKLHISSVKSFKVSSNTFNKIKTSDSFAGYVEVELPDISVNNEKNEVVIKHVGGAQPIHINPPSGTKIDNYYGNNIVIVSNGDSMTFYCDGYNWYIKSYYSNIFTDMPGHTMDTYEAPDIPVIRIQDMDTNQFITEVNLAAYKQIRVHTSDSTDYATSEGNKANPGSNWSAMVWSGDISIQSSGFDGEIVNITPSSNGNASGEIHFNGSGVVGTVLKVNLLK
jgi:hypothetical protein